MRSAISIFFVSALIVSTLWLSSCGPDSTGDKTIKSMKSGDLMIGLSNSTGQLRHGEQDLTLSFTNALGESVDVGAASLKFRMAGMGSMPEMNNTAALTTTNTPGRYRAQVRMEMAGSWEAIVSYQGPQGTGQAKMVVMAK
jgi:YtkA-like